jgi:NifU-like protein involved in Fe-S cluster formation
MDEKRIALLQAMGYPEKAIGYILNKTNVGEMAHPSVSAKDEGTCGDLLILHLLIQEGIIQDAKYDYIGCTGLQAAASALTEMVKGLTLPEAAKIQAQDVLNFFKSSSSIILVSYDLCFYLSFNSSVLFLQKKNYFF